MMDKEEIARLDELTRKFNSECDRVTEVLMSADIYCEPNRTDNPCFADNYRIQDKWVLWWSEDKTHSGSFPVEYLEKGIGELEEVVQQMDDEYRKAREEREARHKLYLELKREFGD